MGRWIDCGHREESQQAGCGGTERGDREARLEPGLRCKASELEAPTLNKGLTACQQRPPSQQLKSSGVEGSMGECRLLSVLQTANNIPRFPLKNKAFHTQAAGYNFQP